MNWIKWLFCPHDWKEKEVTQIWDCDNPSATRPHNHVYLYQCSKCTRFKKMTI